MVNTCAVTGEAVRQARQAIRRLRRERPESRIIVTGCAAQLDPDAFAAMPEVDRVLGNAEKLHRRHYAPAESGGAGMRERIAVSDIMTAPETALPPVDEFDGRSRAMVQIQQGCDHRCTFCAIPFARGPNRSVPADRIVDQVRTLALRGYPEVVLTGVDICSYGATWPVRRASPASSARCWRRSPELRRLRLSSLDPAAIELDLVALMGDEARLMPHAHLSLQAGDDMVLKRMKRRHTRAGALKMVEALRRVRPDIVFGADLIAGFPTETEAMFANTLSFINEARLTYLHVFPFSPRPDTPAARMPQVPGPVRRERAAALRRGRSGRESGVLRRTDWRAGRGRGRKRKHRPLPRFRPCDAGLRGPAGRNHRGKDHRRDARASHRSPGDMSDDDKRNKTGRGAHVPGAAPPEVPGAAPTEYAAGGRTGSAATKPWAERDFAGASRRSAHGRGVEGEGARRGRRLAHASAPRARKFV